VNLGIMVSIELPVADSIRGSPGCKGALRCFM
jgi:hypothetical protein